MIIKDINKMSMPMGSIGEEFQLLFYDNTKDPEVEQFPIFMNLSDDFYVSMLGRTVYEYGLNHIGELKESNLVNKDAFMFSMEPMKFKAAILPNEMAKLREIFFILIDFPMMLEFKKMNLPICIAISTENTGRAVNLTYINDNELRFDVEIK